MKKHGMNWITQRKRLAIYLRDGLACVYCGTGIENGETLSLDHIMPTVDGGSNDAENLATACLRCNNEKGNRTVANFAEWLVEELDPTASPRLIVEKVVEQTEIPLAPYVLVAKLLLETNRNSALRAAIQVSAELKEIESHSNY